LRPHPGPSSIAQVLAGAISTLVAAGCETPRLDAEILLAHILEKSRAWLYAYSEHALTAWQFNDFQGLIARRAAREPVAYLVGRKEFFGLDLIVTPHVLIPRPETERLVELALERVSTWSAGKVIVDVGTGSGAIAVSIAVRTAGAHRIVAADVSSAALSVARQNAFRHEVAGHISCIQADLLAPLSGRLDLVVSNPPYLSEAELATAPPEVSRWEPRAALDGGTDGLSVIRRLLALASVRLGPRGSLLVEIGAGQAAAARALARRHFPASTVKVASDYAGRDRVLVVQQE
jgi:release factor glutamine methyltransferase